MSEHCTTTADAIDSPEVEPKAEETKSPEEINAHRAEVIGRGTSFLHGLQTEPDVFTFIDSLVPYDQYTLVRSILRAHEKVSAEALSAFIAEYYPEQTDQDSIENCAVTVVDNSELWWSHDPTTSQNTVMLKNSLIPHWTAFYSFAVLMISVRDLASFGAKPMSSEQCEEYETEFGLMTPGIEVKVLIKAPTQH
jgi:hypothetical protein